MPLTINGRSLSEALRASIESLKDPRMAGMVGGAVLGGGYGMATGDGFRNSMGRAMIGGATGAAVGYSDLGRDTVEKLRGMDLDISIPRTNELSPMVGESNGTAKIASPEDAYIMGVKRAFDWGAAGREIINPDNLGGAAAFGAAGAGIGAGLGAATAGKGKRLRGAARGAVGGGLVGALAPLLRSATAAGSAPPAPSPESIASIPNPADEIKRLREINASQKAVVPGPTVKVLRSSDADLPGGHPVQAPAQHPAQAPGAVDIALGAAGTATGLTAGRWAGGKAFPLTSGSRPNQIIHSGGRTAGGLAGGLAGAFGGLLTRKLMSGGE